MSSGSKKNKSSHAAPQAAKPAGQRIASIDALRGFDMFWIIGGSGVFLTFVAMFRNPVPGWLAVQLEHVEWRGFSAWDLIMPLFLFVSGASMPFSLPKWASAPEGKKWLYLRIARRIIILWILGMAVQGNLFEYDLSRLHLYSNTLQAIAAGYLISFVFLMTLELRGQIAATAGLLLLYWALMSFVPIPEHGAGVLEPQVNLAMYIDEAILGPFRDGTTYTWILSSLGFGASVMQGVFAGHILRSGWSQNNKCGALLALGAGCLVVGGVWGIWSPIIKHIWTSSMVLWSGGWCYLLLAAFYWVIDVKGYRRWAFPLIVIGTNAIAVYVATHLLDFGAISNVFLGNLTPHLGAFGRFLQAFGAFLVPWLILLYMYRKKTFIRI